MRAVLFILILVGLAGRAEAFRRPEGNLAPLGDFDIRTLTRLPAPVEISTSAARATEKMRLGSTDTLQVRLSAETGRPRHLYRLDGALSDPSKAAPPEIARAFLRDRVDLFGLSEREVAEMAVASFWVDEGARGTAFVVLQQRCGGLDVFNARVGFALDGAGRVYQVWGEYYPGLQQIAKPRLSANEAIQWAAAHCRHGRQAATALDKGFQLKLFSDIGSEYSLQAASFEKSKKQPEGCTPNLFAPNLFGSNVFAPGPFREPVSARLVLMPVGGKGVPAWEMILHLNAMECYLVLVDARDGSLLYRTNLYRFARPVGLVFPEHPDAGTRIEASFLGDSIASPNGWCDAVSTAAQGNNVVAREDAAGDNEITLGFQPADPNWNFYYPFQNAWADQHTTAPDVGAVVTNLFHHCNWYHDYLYRLGFNEKSGNFQLYNFERGGGENDPVYTDAMDGAGFNNSNFLAFRDGVGRSRLQMFLFKPQAPDYALYRDGALDADIIYHEYTHGLLTRVVGRSSSEIPLTDLQSQALAEGWADFLPCSIFDDPVIGEYVTGNRTSGARRYAYDAHPWRFGRMGVTHRVGSLDLPPGSPWGSVLVPEIHSDGEIWAAALWELRRELGNSRLAEYLVVEGLRHTPPNPTALDARDGILLADAVKYGGRHRAAIWKAFASRGLGWSAEAEPGAKAMLMFQAFDWPPDLGGNFTTSSIVFFDDMENDLSGWSIDGYTSGAGVRFQPTTDRAASGRISWLFGLNPVWRYREWGTLESPPIALPAGSGYYLEFQHQRWAEDTVIWDMTPHYFDSAFVYVRDTATSAVEQIGFAFRNTAGWETRRLDLSQFAGRTVRIGFYFDTWDNVDYIQPAEPYEGWYIDDVTVVQSRTLNLPPADAGPAWIRYE